MYLFSFYTITGGLFINIEDKCLALCTRLVFVKRTQNLSFQQTYSLRVLIFYFGDNDELKVQKYFLHLSYRFINYTHIYLENVLQDLQKEMHLSF